MKVIGNINFRTIGETSPQGLDFNKPVIYSSDSMISSLSYAGTSDLIMQSTTFSDEFKRKLVGITGYVSLGTTNGIMKNIHVYSKNAKYLDGVERLCYIQQDGQHLVIREYHGNRGAKYSALYHLLREELAEHGFKEIQGKIVVEENDIDVFVYVVNKIINDREQGNYFFQAVSQVDSVLIRGIKYYYYKAFWVKTGGTEESQQMELVTETSIAQVEQKLREVANFGVDCGDVDVLISLKEKIGKVDKLISDRIQILTTLKDF